MTTPTDLLRARIAEMLMDGRLPYNSIPRIWGGIGNGEECDACEILITADQMIMEGIAVDPHQQPVQFHVKCFSIWDEERRRPRVLQRPNQAGRR